MTDLSAQARAILRKGFLSHWTKVEARELARLDKALMSRLSHSGLHVTSELDSTPRLVVALLLDEISLSDKAVRDIRQAWAIFNERHSRSETEDQRLGHLLDMASVLGATPRTIRGDRRSARRGFGYEAILDRMQDHVSGLEKRLTFLLDRLGQAVALAFTARKPADAARYWKSLDFEIRIMEMTGWPGDTRVRTAAFLSLATCVQAIPPEQQQNSIGDTSLRSIYRASLEASQSVWVQAAAMEVLINLSPSDFAEVAKRRMLERQAGDSLFLRRRIVELVAGVIANRPELGAIVEIAAADTSPHVRQAVAEAAAAMPGDGGRDLLERLALKDDEPCVRISALLNSLKLVASDAQWVAGLVCRCLGGEQSATVARAALSVAETGAAQLVGRHDDVTAWCEPIGDALATVRQTDPSLALRRWAAQTAEWLWCVSTPDAWTLYHELEKMRSGHGSGRWRRLKSQRVLDAMKSDLLGRVLSILARDGFGYEVVDTPIGFFLFRGERMRWRLWRVLHEALRPASDKRQGHSHVIGRVYHGRIQAPASGLAELSQTKVPGEPLVMADEQGWRPYLPLPDQVISAIDSGGKTKIYSAEGVTIIQSPDGLARRIFARFHLVWDFARYSRLRNWHHGTGHNADEYARELSGVGIGMSFLPHADTSHRQIADTAVTRFFPVTLPWLDPDIGARFENYAFSVYQNSLGDLALFLIAVSGLFFGGHIWANAVQRRNRNKLPLVIGGWGTRGKSGTERLKAALFNAIGLGVMSKTTGCEAMFVYCRPFRPLREMFLFRPYDKATIWEQVNVVRMAREMESQVFLWECMGLNPSYVHILQADWMRDDFSTITNTYPDHEDIQGPAGRDIPQVMTKFIPRKAILISSEEQMQPILAEAAASKNTRCLSVGWLEAALIAPDVLARFPYEEHPYNIALVLKLAEELGIRRDFALKEMADRVVPDLGVLKSYPVAEVDGRRLEFVNGMSANERFGCLANWTRMAFDAPAAPDTWITTVVNNRADREARSQVFAGILVDDIAADCHVLIGSNLEGLQGFIRSRWEERMSETTLWPADHESVSDILANWGKWLRIPTSEDQIAAQDQALRANAAEFDADISKYIENRRDTLKRYADLHAAASNARGRDDDIDLKFRALISEIFFSKFLVVDDFHATGDEIISAISARTPPGMLNRIMGIQNIKGTGLDFVYRWQAWDRCCVALKKLQSGEYDTSLEGLRDLAAFSTFGALGTAAVTHALEETSSFPHAQTETFQAQVNGILSTMEAKDRASQGTVRTQSKRWTNRVVEWFVGGVEQFLDVGDAVQRRKKADRIYRDLARQRIGLERAVQELQSLNSRQKGGWLQKLMSKREQDMDKC